MSVGDSARWCLLLFPLGFFFFNSYKSEVATRVQPVFCWNLTFWVCVCTALWHRCWSDKLASLFKKKTKKQKVSQLMALVSKPSVIGNFEFSPNRSKSNSGRGGHVGSYGSSSEANCKGLSLSFFNLTSLLLKVHLCVCLSKILMHCATIHNLCT